jgi:L-histidine N-alpha-methyltransferase
VWDAEEEWIEMRLQASVPHRVRLARLALEVGFEAGEEILTETSAKFRPERVRAELRAAGLTEVGAWSDPADDFRVCLARRGTSPA